MHFSKITSLLAAVAPLALAENLMTFQSVDDVDRTVYFTSQQDLHMPQMEPVKVAAGEEVTVSFLEGWIGNMYAVQPHQTVKPGMLAEVRFNGWNDLVFYDVSAIVDPDDKDNVSELYPKDDPSKPISGCGSLTPFPCNNAYYLPDDVQTKATHQSHLICTLGKNGHGGVVKRDAADYDTESVARDYVLGLKN